MNMQIKQMHYKFHKYFNFFSNQMECLDSLFSIITFFFFIFGKIMRTEGKTIETRYLQYIQKHATILGFCV